MSTAPGCKSCGKTFKTPRGAYLHWLGAHSRFKLRGEGERAVLDALAAVRRKDGT